MAPFDLVVLLSGEKCHGKKLEGGEGGEEPEQREGIRSLLAGRTDDDGSGVPVMEVLRGG